MARAWAGRSQSQGPEEAAEDLRAFGLDAPVLVDPAAHQVLSCCRTTVDVFLTLATQWRRAGQAGVAIGLEYGVIRDTLWLMGLALGRSERAFLFRGLQIMELATLEVWNGNR